MELRELSLRHAYLCNLRPEQNAVEDFTKIRQSTMKLLCKSTKIQLPHRVRQPTKEIIIMSIDNIEPCATPARTVLRGNPPALGDRGFTLVELIAVSAVLAVLTAIAIPAYAKIKDMAREVRAMEEIRGFEKAINAFSIDNGGRLPDDAEGANLIRVLDPWGHPYHYHKIVAPVDPQARYYASQLNYDFDLYSSGANGRTDPDPDIEKPDSQDDILRTGDGGYIGRSWEIIIILTP